VGEYSTTEGAEQTAEQTARGDRSDYQPLLMLPRRSPRPPRPRPPFPPRPPPPLLALRQK